MGITKYQPKWPERANRSGLPAVLSKEWLQDMRIEHSHYHTPILNLSCCRLINAVCYRFHLGTHIFINSIHILEEFIMRRSRQRKLPRHPLLQLLTAVRIASKVRCDFYHGTKWNRKFTRLYMQLRKMKGCKLRHCRRMLDYEVLMLTTLSFHLPIANELEDLEIIVYMYISPLKIANVLMPAKVMLQMYFIYRKRIYARMCKLYPELCEFPMVMRNRYFVPFVVVLAVLHLKNLQRINLSRMEVMFARIGCFDTIYLYLVTTMLLEHWDDGCEQVSARKIFRQTLAQQSVGNRNETHAKARTRRQLPISTI